MQTKFAIIDGVDRGLNSAWHCEAARGALHAQSINPVFSDGGANAARDDRRQSGGSNASDLQR